jgi:hypothetical protein
MSAERYLRLDGTYPDMGRKRLRHIFTAETTAATVFTLATAGAAFGVVGLQAAFIAAACGVASSAGAQAFTRNFMKGSLTHYFGDLDLRLFDCAPDGKTPPTRPSFRVAAAELATRGTVVAAIAGTLALPHTAALLTAAVLMPNIATLAVASAALTGVLGLNIAANAAFIAWRFRRVEKSEWEILDHPPGGGFHRKRTHFHIMPVPGEAMPI